MVVLLLMSSHIFQASSMKRPTARGIAHVVQIVCEATSASKNSAQEQRSRAMIDIRKQLAQPGHHIVQHERSPTETLQMG